MPLTVTRARLLARTALAPMALAGALAACASSPRAAAAPDLERSGIRTTQVQGAGMPTSMNMTENVTAKSAVIDLPPEKTFQALEAAYAALGIPLTTRDVAIRKLGNESFRVRRRVGDVAMTKVFDCGGDMGMPNAETYQVTMSVLSVVKPNDAGGSILQTVVEGQAKNPLTNAANLVRCTSQGALEARIEALVRGR